MLSYLLLSFTSCSDHRDLHSFPTRRSSDLAVHVTTWIFSLEEGERAGTKRLRVNRGPLVESSTWTDAIAGFRSEEHTLNSSHSQISYAVFCLKKKKTIQSSPDRIHYHQ